MPNLGYGGEQHRPEHHPARRSTHLSGEIANRGPQAYAAPGRIGNLRVASQQTDNMAAEPISAYSRPPH